MSFAVKAKGFFLWEQSHQSHSKKVLDVTAAIKMPFWQMQKTW